MAIGGVVIQFTADADKATRDVNKLTKSLDKVGNESSRTGAKMKTMAKVGVAAVAAGVAAAAYSLVQFGKAAITDKQEADALARTLLKLPKVTDAMVASNAKWIASLELATNIADKDLRESMSKLAVATGDVTEAQKLVALATDVAIGRNEELSSVTTILEKAVGGNTTALKKAMPWLDKNKDGVITLDEAMKGLSKRYKGAAEDAAKNDVWGTLMTIWGNLQEAFGQMVLAPLDEFSEWFADKKNQGKILEWIGLIGEWSAEIGEKFRDKIVEFVDYLQSPEGKAAMQEYVDTLKNIAGAIESIGNAVGPVLGKIQDLLNILNKLPGNAILQKLGLIPDFNSSAPKPAFTPNRALSGEQKRALAESRGSGSKKEVNVYVTNGKQEKTLDSAALAIRLARVGF